MPAMKDLVPSIGSSTQTYSASARSLPYSSPTIPCSGKFCRSEALSPGGPVGGSHRIERTNAALVLDAKRGAKNGSMVSPETVASWSTKAAKSMAVMQLTYALFFFSCHGVTKRRIQ
jgi:hypothetical protein